MIAPEQEQSAARAAVADADGQPWDELDLYYVAVSTVSSLRFLRRHGGEESRVSPFSCDMELDDLREAMADEHGTWFSCEVTISADGAYRFTYNYDERPTWSSDRPIEDDTFVADLQQFPRPWSEIPQWHPVRQRFTQESWTAETARQE